MADAGPAPFPVRRLEGFDDLTVVQPGIDWYVARIREGRPFAFLKRTHGFWDRLCELVDASDDFRRIVAAAAAPGGAEPTDADLARAFRIPEDVRKGSLSIRPQFKGFWEGDFGAELVRDLRRPHAAEGWIEAVAFRGFSRSDEKPAHHPPEALRDVFLALRPRNVQFHDALVFKDAVVDGTFLRVIDALRDLPVVVVGPPHFADFGERVGLPRFDHVSIHPTKAIRERDSVLSAVEKRIKRLRGAPAAMILQAGSLSWWVMHRVFPRGPQITYLDVGRAIDVWYPEVVSTQPWFRIDREAIVRNMRLTGHGA